MVFGFSTENFDKKTKTEGIWKMDVNHRIKHANTKNCFSSTPRFRQDCMNGKRMLISQARKVIESGFIKTRLNRDELAQSFHMSRKQVDATLNAYYGLVGGIDSSIFANIDGVFACLVTDDDVMDYHWKVLDDFFESGKQQYYAMEVMEATHLERKECYYFCLMVTRLSGGEFYLDNGGSVKVKSGFGGERYVQAMYDLCWFLAGKVLRILDESVTPMKFFGEGGDWYKYNLYPIVPAYVTKVMEARKRMPGGVTTSEDIEGLFDIYVSSEMSAAKRDDFLDAKLLEWARSMKEECGKYAEIL